jgi:hypothetical protein
MKRREEKREEKRKREIRTFDFLFQCSVWSNREKAKPFVEGNITRTILHEEKREMRRERERRERKRDLQRQSG